MLIPGLAASQSTTPWSYATHHWPPAPSGVSACTANVNGQCPRASSITRQCSRSASPFIAARQCIPWLSPSSTTVSTDASAPKTQASGMPSTPTLAHGTLGVNSARNGVGVTVRSSRALWHGLEGSREAAP